MFRLRLHPKNLNTLITGFVSGRDCNRLPTTPVSAPRPPEPVHRTANPAGLREALPEMRADYCGCCCVVAGELSLDVPAWLLAGEVVASLEDVVVLVETGV